MVEKVCLQCGKSFLVYNYRRKLAKLCSYSCSSTYTSKNKPSSKVKKVCIACNTEFLTWPYRAHIAKYCRINCPKRNKKSNCQGCGKKTSNLYSTRCQQCANGYYVRENSHTWKGEEAGYDAKHKWIYSELGKAQIYQCSKKNNTCTKRLEWSNISGEYLRKLSDWQVLCSSHHQRFDNPKSRKDRVCSKIGCNKKFHPRTDNHKFCSISCGLSSHPANCLTDNI